MQTKRSQYSCDCSWIRATLHYYNANIWHKVNSKHVSFYQLERNKVSNIIWVTTRLAFLLIKDKALNWKNLVLSSCKRANILPHKRHQWLNIGWRLKLLHLTTARIKDKQYYWPINRFLHTDNCPTVSCSIMHNVLAPNTLFKCKMYEYYSPKHLLLFSFCHRHMSLCSSNIYLLHCDQRSVNLMGWQGELSSGPSSWHTTIYN